MLYSIFFPIYLLPSHECFPSLCILSHLPLISWPGNHRLDVRKHLEQAIVLLHRIDHCVAPDLVAIFSNKLTPRALGTEQHRCSTPLIPDKLSTWLPNKTLSSRLPGPAPIIAASWAPLTLCSKLQSLTPYSSILSHGFPPLCHLSLQPTSATDYTISATFLLTFQHKCSTWLFHCRLTCPKLDHITRNPRMVWLGLSTCIVPMISAQDHLSAIFS